MSREFFTHASHFKGRTADSSTQALRRGFPGPLPAAAIGTLLSAHAATSFGILALCPTISLRLVPLPERLQLFEAAKVGVLGHVGDLAQPGQVVGLGGRIRRRRSSRRRPGVLGGAPLGGEAVLLQANALQGRLQIAGAEPAPTVERERDILGGDREHGARRSRRGDHRLQDIEHGWRVGKALAWRLRATPVTFGVARWLRAESVPVWEVAALLGHTMPGHHVTELYAAADPKHMESTKTALDYLLRAVWVSVVGGGFSTKPLSLLERAKGIEPSTLTLAT